MSSNVSFHPGKGQIVKLFADCNKGTFWVTLRVSGEEIHEVTFFVEADEFGRFCHAAKAFNDALAEPVALANAAE